MIIGICGKRGTGKTTLAEYFYKHGFQKESFAQELKSLCDKIWPETPFRTSSNPFSTLPKEFPYKHYKWTPRDFMVQFGQFMRVYDNDYWLNRLDFQEMEGFNIVIDDVRFKNEANKIKQYGGKILRLERYKSLNIYKKELNDPSETDMDDYKWDALIDKKQNQSLNDLCNHGDRILKEWGVI